MTITTKTGDMGTTFLFGGKRVLKSDSSVAAYGSVDELTSFIGLACSKLENKKDKMFLYSIQKDLYKIMAALAGDKRVDLKNLKKQTGIMEKYIKHAEEKLPKLSQFILPSGSELSSWFHILRTVCRRAERGVIKYYSGKLPITNPPAGRAGYRLPITAYLNRLSNLFFMMARKYNKEEKLVNG